MASKKVTLSIPERLYDAMKDFAPKAGYRNMNELMIWSAFYAIIVGKPHPITAPLANSSRDVQEMVFNDILDAIKAGSHKGKGSYFEHLLSEVVEKLGVNATPEVVKAVVSETVREGLRKKSQ